MSRRRIAEKIVEKKYKWLIKWKNYPNSHNSWEPLKNLKSCKSLIAKFEAAGSPNLEPAMYPDGSEKLARECSSEGLKKNDVFEVERILGKKLFYLVKWRGLDSSENEWITQELMLRHKNLIRDFENRRNAGKRKAAPTKSATTADNNQTKPKDEVEIISSDQETSSPSTSSRCSTRSSVNELQPHSIQGMTQLEGEEKKFVVQWQNGTVEIVPTAIASVKWPQLVIAFYEKHLKLR